VTGHQAEPTQGTMQPFQGISGIKNFKRVLQRVSTASVNRCINLNVPPGKHQKSRAELVNGDPQNPVHIKNWERGQIKNALRNSWKALMEMIGQVDRANRKNGIARQPDQQHPFSGKLGLSQKLSRLQKALHGSDANNHVPENA
tara:strand:- start:168 stop:599 length:432 start_codon:yes stop_codon:yes gene_type:complete